MVAVAQKTNVAARTRGCGSAAPKPLTPDLRGDKSENRLIKSESLASVPDAAKVKVENLYDYMGRRVRKTVSSDYSGGSYTTTNVTTFIYDGWNPIAEIVDDGSTVATNYHVWGIDASGTLQGAGGVGGLLATIQDGETYFACMDGNGNVCQYVDTNGTVVAHREYDPFGGTIALTGDKKNDFTHWFSTQHLDAETDLYAYTFRHYSSSLGRFLSKDPIGELGGMNVYAFVRNQPISLIDILGLTVDFRDRLPDCDSSRLGECRFAEIDRFIVNARGVRVANVDVSVDAGSRSLLLNFDFMSGTEELDAYRAFSRFARTLDFFQYLALAYRYNRADFMATAFYTELTAAMGEAIANSMADLVQTIRAQEQLVTLSLEYKCTTCKCKRFLFWRYGYGWDDDRRARQYPCVDPIYSLGGNSYVRGDLFSRPMADNVFRRCFFNLLDEKPCEE